MSTKIKNIESVAPVSTQLTNMPMPNLDVKIRTKWHEKYINREKKRPPEQRAKIQALLEIHPSLTFQECEKMILALEDQEKVANLPGSLVDRFEIRLGDVNSPSPDLTGKVDLVLSDPPYGRLYRHLYKSIAEFALTTLRPWGQLAIMAGSNDLDFVHNALAPYASQGLVWRTNATILLTGNARPTIYPARYSACTKPLMIYTKIPDPSGKIRADKSTPWITDLFKVTDSSLGDLIHDGGPDKAHHHWGQSTIAFSEAISRLSRPGELVCDPFCGGGTTGYSALKLDRRFIGIDIDPVAVETSRNRLNELAASTNSDSTERNAA